MRLGDVECDARHGSLRRYEQRLERSEKTTSDCPGTARMAIAAHRARDRGASGDRRRLSESDRDQSAPPGAWGQRTPAKAANETEVTTGSDAAKPVNTVHLDCNPKPQPRKPSQFLVCRAYGVPSTRNQIFAWSIYRYEVNATSVKLTHPVNEA